MRPRPRGRSPALSLPGSSRQSMITAGACLGFGGDHGCPRTKCGHDSMGNAAITVAPTRISLTLHPGYAYYVAGVSLGTSIFSAFCWACAKS